MLSPPSMPNVSGPHHLAFPAGDIHRYDELCTRHATLLNAQPALVAHERRLREKITILCLMELISGLPPDRRTVALADVAQRTKLPLDGVEFLLMKVWSAAPRAAPCCPVPLPSRFVCGDVGQPVWV